MIGILVIPAMFVIFQTIEEKIKKPERKNISELTSFEGDEEEFDG
jgi:HAE1 family hydrophobic/amphiphilic exporter-1